MARSRRSGLPLRERADLRRNPKRNRKAAREQTAYRHLESWLAKDLHEWFENRLLIIDEAIANRWGLLAALAQRVGTPLAIIDGLLGATAFEMGLTIVTRNAADFANVGVAVLNPWQI